MGPIDRNLKNFDILGWPQSIFLSLAAWPLFPLSPIRSRFICHSLLIANGSSDVLLCRGAVELELLRQKWQQNDEQQLQFGSLSKAYHLLSTSTELSNVFPKKSLISKTIINCTKIKWKFSKNFNVSILGFWKSGRLEFLLYSLCSLSKSARVAFDIGKIR